MRQAAVALSTLRSLISGSQLHALWALLGSTVYRVAAACPLWCTPCSLKRLFVCLGVCLYLGRALEGVMYQAAAEQLLHLLHFDLGREGVVAGEAISVGWRLANCLEIIDGLQARQIFKHDPLCICSGYLYSISTPHQGVGGGWMHH